MRASDVLGPQIGRRSALRECHLQRLKAVAETRRRIRADAARRQRQRRSEMLHEQIGRHIRRAHGVRRVHQVHQSTRPRTAARQRRRDRVSNAVHLFFQPVGRHVDREALTAPDDRNLVWLTIVDDDAFVRSERHLTAVMPEPAFPGPQVDHAEQRRVASGDDRRRSTHDLCAVHVDVAQRQRTELALPQRRLEGVAVFDADVDDIDGTPHGFEPEAPHVRTRHFGRAPARFVHAMFMRR